MSTELGTQPSSLAMIRTLGGIAMLSGILIVLVYQITFPIIMENKRIALEAAVFKVIPNAVSKVSFVLTPDAVVKLDDMSTSTVEGAKIYAGYDENQQLVGIAMEAKAPGYQDTVQTLYGYSPTCECIVGMTVLQSKETPGLGDKVETDPEFLANFKALDAKLNVSKTELANDIITVRHGRKTNAWQIDAISGATVTSKAIGKGLNNSTQKLLPMLVKYLDGLSIKTN